MLNPDDVKDIQTQLNKLLNADLDVDGIYGPLTTEAVKVFQARSGLTADGIVGVKTSQAIYNASKERGFGILERIRSWFP